MPSIIWNRRCKRCNGQLSLERASDGLYLTCIQCGSSEKESAGISNHAPRANPLMVEKAEPAKVAW